MSHTVIGFFEELQAGKNAAEALVNNGFAKEDIDVDSRRTNADTTAMNEEDDNENGLVKFFRNLFGNKGDHADNFNKLANECGAVVRVYTSSESEADRAANILDDEGAFDVDERMARFAEAGSPRAITDDAGWNGPGSRRDETNTPNPSGNRKDKQHPELLSTEEAPETPRVEEHSGPGASSMATSGKRSNARIFEYKGEASARLREDRDNETKFW